jgi:hypothetical protein
MPMIATTRAVRLTDPPLVFIGVDPGVSGGLALLTGRHVEATAMPDDADGIWKWIYACRGLHSICCMELVTGWVGGHNREGGEEEARKTNPGASMFRFGTNNGMLLMALHAAGIPVDLVGASVWQRALGIRKRQPGTKSGAWKNQLKAEAQRLFPELKVTKATADALLLAAYCRMKHGR